MSRTRARKRASRSHRPRGRGQITFRYRSQYGVIVLCQDEAHQKRIYQRLSRQGLTCKVVVV